MMTYLPYLLILGVAYWRVRNLYYNKIELEYQHKIFLLRDKLRRYAIEGKINPNDWFFDYLDKSFCKSIEKITALNFLLIFFLHRKNKNNQNVATMSTKTSQVIKKNKYSKEVYNEFGMYLSWYFYKKHYIISAFLKLIFSILHSVNSIKFVASNSLRMVEDLRLYPETSASGEKSLRAA